MRTAVAIALSLLAPAIAGCLGNDDPVPSNGNGRSNGTAPDGTVQAPWWPVGSWWDVSIQRGTGAEQRVRLVSFLNDSRTAHFWLGVEERRSAMDHALYDTNPLLGRIHWGLLTPHEKGIHATGMYTFPVKPGDAFGGLAFGHEWDITASAGASPGALEFEGRATDGARIRYDYDPSSMWFTFIDLTRAGGANELKVRVLDHGTGATGTYWFLRGRDYYEGPASGGTHEETFEVKEEEIAHKSLAVRIKGRATGPLRMDFVDPSGDVKHTETLLQAPADKLLEIATPEKGTWKVRYTGTGSFEGTILATGILEYTAKL